MIDPRDIQELAKELSLDPRIVEKDYVLGWLLAGIAGDAEIGGTWTFKGGTCLKKIHFETYRFSEDLDFTVTRPEQLDDAFLRERFRAIAAWVYDRCGVELPAERARFEIYPNPRGGLNAEGRVYYRGPLRPPRDLPRIKIDLTADEALVLDPEERRVVHPYRDEPEGGISVLCYAYAEIFAEKIRALHDRGRPRDLYDVIHLYRRSDARALRSSVVAVLAKKCAYKGLDVPTLESVRSHEPLLRGQWASMLEHQLPVLPAFEVFWNELPGFFEWLLGHSEPTEAPIHPKAARQALVSIPLGGFFNSLGIAGAPMEAVRFAAANRLCVELDYVEENGKRSTRIIEPYSLRRSSEGHVLLHTERADGRGHRSYRVDRIRGARATNQVFVPRFAVELAPPAVVGRVR